MAFLILEISSRDAYERFYKSIPEEEYYTIIQTVQGKDNDELLLPETKWALGLYKKKSPRFMEDLPKLRNERGDGYLDIFLRAKERRMISGIQADLNQYKSIAELGRFVSSLDIETILGRTKGEMSNAVHEAKDDIEKLYEDDEWIILIPKTHEASCYWAQGAHWCTAYRDDDEWFNKYSSEGPLFMNIHKENPQLSTQFHIESDQYMDYYDNAIEEPIFEQIHDGDTLLDFYQNYLPAEKFIKIVGSELGNGLYVAYLYDYDYGEDGHDNEYAYFMVDINLNRLGGPFEDMYTFNGNDVTRVIYNDSKYNLVDTNGRLQFDEPLIDIKQVHSLKNKFVGKTCNASLMDDDGNITTKENSHIIAYDNGEVIHFSQYNNCTCYWDFTLVRGKDNFNILNSNFQPIFKHDYLNIRPFELGGKQYFAIQKMNKWNISDISGNILWDNWVYDLAPNLTINGLPIKTFKVNTGIGLNLYDVNGNPMMGEDVEKFTWSNWKTDGVVSGVMMLNGDYNFLDNKFNIIDGNGKILYKGLYKPMNESRRILNEITVQDASTRFYSDIPANDFMEIINTLQGGNQILLPETKWALSLYKKKSPRFMEDLYKLHNENGSGYLDIIKRAKDRRIISGQQADLNQYKSISELGRFISSLDIDKILGKTKGEMSNAVNAAAEDIEVPYEDDVWKVVIPKSYEASCYWGNGTEWCTATRETSDWYNEYSNQGPLYININKQNGQKFQFHFETDSFMDQYDSEIEIPFINEMGENNIEGLVNFYIKLKGKEWKEVFTGYDKNGLKKVYVFDEGGFNLKKEDDGKFLFDRCYEDIGYYDENGFYPVQNENDEWNLITIDGNYISDNWYDYISNFFDGVAIVGKKGLPFPNSWGMSYNLMNLKGEILLDEWYANIGSFCYGFARIYKNGKVNIVNNKGEIVLPKWYEEIISIDDEGFTVGDYVHNIYMHNKLDFNGNPIYEWVTNRYKVGEKPDTNFWESKTFTNEELKFIKETVKKLLK